MLMTFSATPSSLSWQDQLKMLRAALLHDPANPLAWRWRVRVKVLAFLMSRYCGEGNFMLAEPKPRSVKLVLKPEFVMFEDSSLPRQKRTMIRKRLKEIARINRAVVR